MDGATKQQSGEAKDNVKRGTKRSRDESQPGEQQQADEKDMPVEVTKEDADGSDKRQTHKFTVSTSTFEIDSKFVPIKQIGAGAYGVVIAATDSETGEKVAIKKIRRAFDDLIDAKRILREIKLLRHFDHDNVISVIDILPPPSLHEFEDVYIVTDLMETDLHRVIYSRQALTDDHIQYFLYQILCALKYIHSADVLHRDLKPSNILLNSNCDLKICDFGLARGVMPEDDESEQAGANLTEYVVTRWYRAPEIMLSCQDYKKGIDLWSVGCIFAEMLGRKPLFPGNDYIHQLKIIAEIVGKPKEEDMDFIGNEKAKRFMLSLEDKGAKDLASMYPQAEDSAIDLLNQMLVFHPDRRISVEAALAHPYMASLHTPEDEPFADKPFNFDFESNSLDEKAVLQKLIFDEVRSYHPDAVE